MHHLEILPPLLIFNTRPKRTASAATTATTATASTNQFSSYQISIHWIPSSLPPLLPRKETRKASIQASLFISTSNGQTAPSAASNVQFFNFQIEGISPTRLFPLAIWNILCIIMSPCRCVRVWSCFICWSKINLVSNGRPTRLITICIHFY